MLRLSIIIPFFGELSLFESTLASVLQNRPGGCQILVAHRGDYQDPWNLADEVEFLTQRSDATLLDLVNAGLHEARAEVFHVLLAGTEVNEGWTIPVLSHFAYPRVGAVAPLLTSSADSQQVLARGLRVNRHFDRVIVDRQSPLDARNPLRATTNDLVHGPIFSAAFYRTDALLDIGGFDPQLGPDFSDADVATTLKTIGYRCVHEPACRLQLPRHSTTTWSTTTARQAERLFWRHTDQLGMAARMGRALSTLMRKLTQADATGGYRSLLGRLTAATEQTRYQQFRDSIALLRQKTQQELRKLDPHDTLSTDDREATRSASSSRTGDRRAA
ncbi:MAG: glycosyltransferase family 2 protein [Planctomycetota bacterium]